MPYRTLAWAASLLVVAIGGCTAPQPGSPRVAGETAARNEALFAPAAAWTDEDPWQAFEYARRDDQMSIASAELPTAADQWPHPLQPSLTYRRSASLGTFNPDSVVFFSPDRYHWRAHRPYHSYWHWRDYRR